MSDIVDRLMNYDTCHDGDVDEAAKEIARLRTQNEKLRAFAELVAGKTTLADAERNASTMEHYPNTNAAWISEVVLQACKLLGRA